MFVTDIKDYAKGRFEVYLNDEFAFVLYKSELNKYGIAVGAELSDDTIELIKSEVLTKRAKKRAMNLLLKGDMTESRLYSKLSDNKYPDDVIRLAIDYVKSYGYIDDRRYAQGFIRSKAGTYSRQAIRAKLLERGVDKGIIDEELTGFYDNDELNSGLEDELILKLIHKKCKNPEELDYDGRQRLIAYLVRKGFSYSQADKFLT